MQYLINNKVILSHEGLRTPGASEAEVRLTKVPLRLLYVLAENPNTNISRTHIFDRVWEQYGQEASGASLTVHLSNLRKQLDSFGIEHDAIRVLPSREVYFSATVEVIPDESRNNPPQPDAGEPETGSPTSTGNENIKDGPGQTAPARIKLKAVISGVAMLITLCLTAVSLFGGRLIPDNKAERPMSYAGWELAGQIKNCKYYFLKDYLVRSYNVRDKIEDSITQNNIKCVPSDMILVSVHDRNATEERRTEPERDFMAFCHAADEGFACESFYYYNGK